jgi:hypothetical protein
LQAKKHNSKVAHKLLVRQRVAGLLGNSAEILETFSGEGLMYDGCWSMFSGACIDSDAAKARDSARSRPRWRTYCGDTGRALSAGWLSSVAFDVVDIDPYGEPWPYVRAFFDTERAMPDQWWLILTDGYWPQMNRSGMSKTLFGDRCGQRISGVSAASYIEMSRDFIGGEAERVGFVVGGMVSQRQDKRTAGVGQHVALIQRNSKRETPELEELLSWA